MPGIVIEKQGKEWLKIFWNSHSFIVQTRKSRAGKIQNYIYYFEFSHSWFPRWEDKRAGISKKFQLFFILFFYIPWVHITLYFPFQKPLWNKKGLVWISKYVVYVKQHFQVEIEVVLVHTLHCTRILLSTTAETYKRKEKGEKFKNRVV